MACWSQVEWSMRVAVSCRMVVMTRVSVAHLLLVAEDWRGWEPEVWQSPLGELSKWLSVCRRKFPLKGHRNGGLAILSVGRRRCRLAVLIPYSLYDNIYYSEGSG